MKILIVIPKFSGHEEEIKLAKKFDIDVIAYDEKKFIKFKWYLQIFIPFILVLSSLGLLNYYRVMYYFRDYKFLNKYIKDQLDQRLKNVYDKVLWIKAAGIDNSVIESDGSCKRNRFLYLYDPVTRYPNITSIANLFEKVSTFDPLDSEQYQMEYIPMYSDGNAVVTNLNNTSPKFDLVYVGSFTIQRLISCLMILFYLRDKKCKLVLGNQSLPAVNILGVDCINVNLNRNKLIDIYRRSRVVLELRDLDQSGASQRKNDSLTLGLPYLSIPCFSLRNIAIYRALKDELMLFGLKKGAIIDINNNQFHSEPPLRPDDFLIKVFAHES